MATRTDWKKKHEDLLKRSATELNTKQGIITQQRKDHQRNMDAMKVERNKATDRANELQLELNTAKRDLDGLTVQITAHKDDAEKMRGTAAHWLEKFTNLKSAVEAVIKL